MGVRLSVLDPVVCITTKNNRGCAQQGADDTLPVAFFKLFLGRAGGGRGVFMGSLGPSWQSTPL